MNTRSADHLTPLHLARQGGFDRLAASLIFHGADRRLRPASRSRQIDTMFHVKQDGPGVAVVVIQDGRVRHKRGYGLADLETKALVTPDTPFYLCSVGKQFTAMAVMMLANQGKLGYDDRLIQFFPDFPPYAREITIRHMLYHTSGLLDYLNDGLAKDTKGITNRQVVDLLKRHELEFAPGERWDYSNSGYTLLSMIAERVSGQPFHAIHGSRPR